MDAEQRKKWAAATTCWTCGRKGHIARFCRSLGVEQKSRNSSPSMVKANHSKAKESPVIVPTLSVSCGSSYCIMGVILSAPVEFVLDTAWSRRVADT